MGEGLHLGGVHLPGDVLGFILLGKEHGNAKLLGHHTGNANARGLDGEDFRHVVVGKQPCPLLAHLRKESHVHLVVEEAVHL